MLCLQAILVLVLTSVDASAAPFDKPWGWSWGPQSGPSVPTHYIPNGKRLPGPDSNAPTCVLAAAVMPAAPTPLPPPAPGLALSHVAIGRGTQNYTCDLTNATATPVAVGAVATLFNVSCMAADSPSLVASLPNIALNLPVPSTTNEKDVSYQDMSGHHYFLDATTPFFNMDTSLHQYGTGAFKKSNSSNAPASAMVGQNNQGHGAVAWLKLDAKTSNGQVFQEVYRLNTAGGQPPSSCTGMPAAFEVEYAAEYWLFS